MKYLTVVLLCALATSKLTVQGAFARKSVKGFSDSVLFNGLIFTFSALLFLWRAINAGVVVWIYSALFGIFSVAFQICYTRAMALGNVSLTVLIVNLSMIISVAFSFVAFGEPLSIMRISGILLTVVAFFVVTDFKEKKKADIKWLLLAVASMLLNGALGITQNVFGKSNYSAENGAFVSRAYIVAAAVSIIIYFVLGHKDADLSVKKKPSILIYAAATGVILSVFQFFNTYALATVDGTFLFPAYSGGCIVFSMLSSLIIFKECLNKKQIVGLLVGVMALILMNF